MYGAVATLVATGLGMGYMNGFGVPFFGLYTTPALPKGKTNGPMAGYMFKTHKYAGVVLEYGVALHVVGFAAHLLTGQNLLTRLTGPMGTMFLAVPWVALVAAVAYSTKPNKLPEFPNAFSPPSGEAPPKKPEE